MKVSALRKMIPINAPQIDEREIEMVTKVLKSGFLTSRVGSSSMVASFEQAYARFAEAKHAVAVNSGTAALHMTLSAAGIMPGDEVILPSFTFVATAEAVALCGAKPVCVDITPQTYNIDPEKFGKAINAKKATMTTSHQGNCLYNSLRSLPPSCSSNVDMGPPF